MTDGRNPTYIFITFLINALASRATYCNNTVIQDKVPVPSLDTSMITLMAVRSAWHSKKKIRLLIRKLADRVPVVPNGRKPQLYVNS